MALSLGLFIITGCGDNHESKGGDTSHSPTTNKPAIDKKAFSLLEKGFLNDISMSLAGNRALVKKTWAMKFLNIDSEISSKTLSIEYDKNEIAADGQFKNKTLLIRGKIKAISKDVFGNPFLSLPGKNSFQGVHAKFNEKNLQELAALKKGESVDVICKISGLVVGDVMARDCTTLAYRLDDSAGKRNKYLEDILLGKKFIAKNEKELARSIAFGYLLANYIPENSECYNDIQSKSCEVDLNKVFEIKSEQEKQEKKEMAEKIEAFMDKLTEKP